MSTTTYVSFRNKKDISIFRMKIRLISCYGYDISCSRLNLPYNYPKYCKLTEFQMNLNFMIN